MPVLFENCPVTIAGTGVYAMSASLDQSVSFEEIKVLGLSNTTMVGNEPPKGSFSADFIIHDDALINNMTGFKGSREFFTCVAGPYTAHDCLFSSFGLSAEPNSPVTANFSAEVFGEITTGSTPAVGSAGVTGAHSSTMVSDFSTVGYSSKPFSFSYDLTQSYNIIYSLTGGFVPVIKEVEGGEESVTVEGDDIASVLTGANGAVCIDRVGEMSVSWDDGCGNSRGSLTLGGYLTSRDISIGENDIVRGNVSITNPY